MHKLCTIPESVSTYIDYHTFVQNLKYCRFVWLIIYVGESPVGETSSYRLPVYTAVMYVL